MKWLKSIVIVLAAAVVRAGKENPDEIVGTCGTRDEVKALVVDILCKVKKVAWVSWLNVASKL
jgi:hypothetical protein